MDRTRLPDGNEPDPEGERDARSEDESTCLNRGHLRNTFVLERFGKSLDGSGKELSVGEKPNNVGVAVDPNALSSAEAKPAEPGAAPKAPPKPVAEPQPDDYTSRLLKAKKKVWGDRAQDRGFDPDAKDDK